MLPNMSGLTMRWRKKSEDLETNKNENTVTQNQRDIDKAVLRGIFIALYSYLKNQEKSSNKHSNLHLKKLKKE